MWLLVHDLEVYNYLIDTSENLKASCYCVSFALEGVGYMDVTHGNNNYSFNNVPFFIILNTP